MNDYLKTEQDLEQKVEQEPAKEPTVLEPRVIYVKKKGGFGKKLLLGTGLILAGTAWAANEARKRIWKFFYPPTAKRYFAVAAMAATFYGATHCNDVSKGANTIYNNAKKQLSIVEYQNKQIKTLNQMLEEKSKGFENKAAIPEQRISSAYQQLTSSSNSNLSTDLATRIQSFGSKLGSDYSYIIYVDKQANKLSLFEKEQGKFKLAKSYNCSTGINPSQKTRVGDKATPEGVFKFTNRNFEQRLPLYGIGRIGTECDGIVLCGAALPERIQAIDNNEGITNGGIITKDQALAEMDNMLGHYWSRALLVSENPSRPVIK